MADNPDILKKASVNFFKSRLGILIIIFAASFLIIVSLVLLKSKFQSITAKPTDKLVSTPKPDKTPSLAEISFTCPVPTDLCKFKKNTKYQDSPAISFKVPKDTDVSTIMPALEFRDFLFNKDKKILKGFYQTYQLNNDCYTVIYTFPEDTRTDQSSKLALSPGTSIGKIGSKTIKIDEDTEANLIIQLRSIPLAKVNPNPQKQNCEVETLRPLDFGQYLDVTTINFN